MAALTPGSTVRVEPADAPLTAGSPTGWRLVVDGDDWGRIRDGQVELDELTLRVRPTGERSELVTGTGTPVLRFDPAGRKATTLTTASGRFRLARQRPRPLQHRWLLTTGVHGSAVMTVTRTPLGVRVRVSDDTEVAAGELAVLAAGALADVLDVEPAAAAA
jgi:hypothetical protein